MIHSPHRVAQLILLTGTLTLAAVATAGLKDKPPQGLTLSGTEWRIDPHRSDDPNAVIDKAHRDMQAQGGRDRGGMDRGVPGGGDGTWGGGENSEGAWGGGYPDRASRRGNSPNDRGGWGHDQGGSSTNVDPTGRTQSASIQWGSPRRSEFLDPLRKNPDQLTFREVNQHLTVTADRLETECEAGVKAPISDSYGDGERNA